MTTLREPQVRPTPPPVREVATPPTRSWWQKHSKQIIVPIALTMAGVIGAVSVIVVMSMDGDVSPSPAPAAAAAPEAAPITAPATPATPAPAAPVVAAPSAPSANVTSPVATKGFASGNYKFSQITTSSPNVVVAFVAAAINQERLPIALYGDVLVLADAEPFALLRVKLKDPRDESFLVIGSLRDPTSGKFLDPKDVVPDVKYPVSALVAEPWASATSYSVWEMDFNLSKTSSGEWRIRNFSTPSAGSRGWDGNAFREELKRVGNEPFRLK